MASESIDISGADCSWCLNETLDKVRALQGVTAVESSMAAGCVRVEHGLSDIEPILAVLRHGLRGSDLSTNESQLVAVEPSTGARCSHGS